MLRIGLLFCLCWTSFAFQSPVHRLDLTNRRFSHARSANAPFLQIRAQCEPTTQKKRIERPTIPAPIYGASPLLAIAASFFMEPAAALAAAPEWLEPTRSSLDIFLAIFSTLFFVRIPISWYPQMDLNKLPQAIVCW
jgi:hypothetical protein